MPAKPIPPLYIHILLLPLAPKTPPLLAPSPIPLPSPTATPHDRSRRSTSPTKASAGTERTCVRESHQAIDRSGSHGPRAGVFRCGRDRTLHVRVHLGTREFRSRLVRDPASGTSTLAGLFLFSTFALASISVSRLFPFLRSARRSARGVVVVITARSIGAKGGDLMRCPNW